MVTLYSLNMFRFLKTNPVGGDMVLLAAFGTTNVKCFAHGVGRVVGTLGSETRFAGSMRS